MAAAWIALNWSCPPRVESPVESRLRCQHPEVGQQRDWSGEALDRETVALRALRMASSVVVFRFRRALAGHVRVMAGQHFLNGSSLCRIEEFAGGRMSCCLFFRHDWLDGILAALHVADSFPLRGDCLASGELPSCLVLLAFDDLNSPVRAADRRLSRTWL